LSDTGTPINDLHLFNLKVFLILCEERDLYNSVANCSTKVANLQRYTKYSDCLGTFDFNVLHVLSFSQFLTDRVG